MIPAAPEVAMGQGCKFETRLGSRMSSRLAWAIGEARLQDEK